MRPAPRQRTSLSGSSTPRWVAGLDRDLACCGLTLHVGEHALVLRSPHSGCTSSLELIARTAEGWVAVVGEGERAARLATDRLEAAEVVQVVGWGAIRGEAT